MEYFFAGIVVIVIVLLILWSLTLVAKYVPYAGKVLYFINAVGLLITGIIVLNKMNAMENPRDTWFLYAAIVASVAAAGTCFESAEFMLEYSYSHTDYEVKVHSYSNSATVRSTDIYDGFITKILIEFGICLFICVILGLINPKAIPIAAIIYGSFILLSFVVMLLKWIKRKTSREYY